MAAQDWLELGRIGSPYGIKGWVHVQSFTDPPERLLKYRAWTLQAESLALQGKTREAEATLKEAYDHGWRATWRADREPYLQGVDLSWLAAKKP